MVNNVYTLKMQVDPSNSLVEQRKIYFCCQKKRKLPLENYSLCSARKVTFYPSKNDGKP